MTKSVRRLNIGAGRDIRPKEDGWINADIRHLPGIDVVFDATKEFPFYLDLHRAEALFRGLLWGAFSEVMAFDLVEHLPFGKIPFFLSECFRVLAPGGILHLRLPDLPKIMRKAVGGSLPWEEAVRLVYGDQTEEAGGAFGAHRHGYTVATISKLLLDAGFAPVEVDVHPTEFNLYVTARRPE